MKRMTPFVFSGFLLSSLGLKTHFLVPDRQICLDFQRAVNPIWSMTR